MKIRLSLILVCAFVFELASGQEQANVITTAVPFLQIAPDARAGGMGTVGVSTTADVYSLFWNPAKYAFIEKDFGFGIGYVPWLRGVVNDIGLASLYFYKRFGDKQAIGAGLRFFSLGAVTFTNDQGQDLGEYKPNEWTIDATYSRKFSRTISGAVAGRFIYSNLIPVDITKYNTKPGISVAADIAFYYHQPLEIKGLNNAWVNFGLDISNIGNKMSYSSTTIETDFIPTNLRLGPSFTMDLDEYNRLSFGIDFNKLLVPTPPIYLKDSNNQIVTGPDGQWVIEKGMDPNVSPIKGMIQSFYDAPYGFKEELQEITVSIGTEYWYNKLFSIRAGYFYESKYKGGRQYFNVGAGLRYNVFGLDFSYLIPVKSNNPLQNTLQFTLLFSFDPQKKAKQANTEQ
jgi:hypothetical protein